MIDVWYSDVRDMLRDMTEMERINEVFRMTAFWWNGGKSPHAEIWGEENAK